MMRVWHMPQVPGPTFYVEVRTVEQARSVLKMLADYDLFQLEHKIKPDYANSQGLEVHDPEFGWCEWEDSEGNPIGETE